MTHGVDINVEQYTAESLSAAHHVLRAPRRRLVIVLVAHRVLSGIDDDHEASDGAAPLHHPPIMVRRIAKEIVAVEESVSVDHAGGDAYHNVYTSLIQTHLDVLDDVGGIAYDHDRKKIKPDKNLFGLAVLAAISSPIAQMFFHDGIADLYRSGGTSVQNSMGD